MIRLFLLLLITVTFCSCRTTEQFTYEPDNLILHPTIQHRNAPPGFKEDFLKTPSGATINILYNTDIEDDTVCVFFLHGNGDTIWSDGLLSFYSLVHSYGFAVVAIDYKGYGKSSKTSHITTLLEDAQTGYDFVQKYFTEEQIIIWGKSLGTIPAIQLARTHEKSVVVLESTISNMSDLEIPLETLFSTRRKTIDLIIENAHVFDNTIPIQHIPNTTLMIHGKKDTVALFTIAQHMFDSIQHTQKHFMTIKNEGHNYSSVHVLEESLQLLQRTMHNRS